MSKKFLIFANKLTKLSDLARSFWEWSVYKRGKPSLAFKHS